LGVQSDHAGGDGVGGVVGKTTALTALRGDVVAAVPVSSAAPAGLLRWDGSKWTALPQPAPPVHGE
jgi:hypothetical protein